MPAFAVPDQLAALEAQFRRYLDLAGNIFIVLDPQGRVRLINRRGCETLGAPRAKLLGRDWLSFVPKPRRAGWRARFKKLLAGRGALSRFEVPVLGRRGERLVSWQNTLLRGPSGSRIAVLAAGEDVTEKRRAEDDLAQSRRRLEGQFKHALDAIVLVDAKARLIDANPAACALFALPRRRVLGRTLLAFFRGAGSRSQWRAMLRAGSGSCDHTILRRGLPAAQAECRAVADIIPGLHMVVLRDVTESRRAQAALAESEEKYRRLLEALPDAIFIHSGGRVVFVNPAALRLLGAKRPSQLVGKRILELVHPECRAAVVRRVQDIKSGRRAPAMQEKLLRLDGSSVDVEASGAPAVFDGRPAVEVIVRDVTERRRSEEALRESEERLRLLVEGVKDYALVMLDASGVVSSWNAGAQRVLGYTAAEASGQPYSLFFRPKELSQGRPQRSLRRARLEGRMEHEGWRRRKGGEDFWAHFVITAVRGSAGELCGYAVILRDVTERRRLENEMIDFVSREQQRIGRDLHDGLGQHLTGLSLLSEALQRKLAARAPQESAEAGRISTLASDAIAQTRALSRGLDPVERRPDGLAQALESLASSASELLGVRCVFWRQGEALVFSHSQAVQLYRIAQEAVNNAVKHGKPAAVAISLGVHDGSVHLSVEDDGRGLGAKKSGGMGLRSMEYRARMMGGTLSIEGNQGAGATVVCSCPIQEGPVAPGRQP